METKSDSGTSRPDPSWSSLPYDLAVKFASLLEASDVCSLAFCSRFWCEVCASDSVWFSLYKRRWPSAVGDLEASPSQKLSSAISDLLAPPSQGYRDFYVSKHQKMASAVSAIIIFVEEFSKSGSLEVGFYLKAIGDLGLLGLGFKDVQLFLFRKEQSVLLNLIGLHYCLFTLDIPSVDLKEVLGSCQILEREVCVSWSILGRWFYGFRLPDDKRSRTISLMALAVDKQDEALCVLNRGAIHEVLRVQITVVSTSAA